jgi:acyl-CoA reductase-like NAD-dependent aldehyde dehydrogenase
MRVLTEEVFGPVLPIAPFNTEEEAVRLANNTQYGLSAEVYTTDLEKGERVAKQINAGTVAINTDNFFKPECPFGGCKKSGMGREYGEIGMKEFSQVKLIAVNKL